MNRVLAGCSGQGHSRSPSGTSPEGLASDCATAKSCGDTTGPPEVPATDWTTARLRDGTNGSTMTSLAGCCIGTDGSTGTSASSSDGISTTLSTWSATGCPDPGPTTSSLGAFSSGDKGEPYDPLPSKAGSSVSLASVTRVTSNATTTIGIGITANTYAIAAASSIAKLEGTILGTKGLATATRCRTSFQVSCTIVGAILIPGIPKPLTEDRVRANPTCSYLACGSPRPLAQGSPTRAAAGVSPDYESRIDRAPVCPSDCSDYLATFTAGRASSGCKFGVGTGPAAAHSPGRSSDCSARLAVSATGNDGAGNTIEGRGDRVRFAARSPTVSVLAARFFNVGTYARRAASCSPPVDITMGS
ncbi:uncharacterized protein [Miscanthus floridulus]|uniref:uncharacterized protein n=1 Tax=Miscanthus floridulus TaxID=154761 RepID=UPI0034595777